MVRVVIALAALAFAASACTPAKPVGDGLRLQAAVR